MAEILSFPDGAPLAPPPSLIGHPCRWQGHTGRIVGIHRTGWLLIQIQEYGAQVYVDPDEVEVTG